MGAVKVIVCAESGAGKTGLLEHDRFQNHFGPLARSVAEAPNAQRNHAPVRRGALFLLQASDERQRARTAAYAGSL